MARRYQPWYGFIIWLARTVLFKLTGGIRVVGQDNVPFTGPLIVAPNHSSNLDPEAAAVCVGRQITFMAKAQLFNVPVLGQLIRSLGAFPVHRGTADTEALRLTYKLLGEGRAVLVFPEGTRGDGKQLLPVSRGIAMIAKRSGAPVLPVAIIGTHRKMPKGRSWIGWGKTVVAFGTPLRIEDFQAGRSEKEAGEALAGAWVNQILSMCRNHGWDLKEPEAQTLSQSQAESSKSSTDTTG